MVNSDDEHSIESIQYTKTRTAFLDPDILHNNRIIMGDNNNPRADIFRVLRTKILKRLRDNSWNSFAITSATPDAGKTFISVNLAIAIAMEGNQSVLIVDADLKRPSIAKCIG
ncbi:MAG: exopolysaccharide biosynthesis protein, partial [Methyloprofundus sp.]|nr:exopolysaccharide biosynthesis protein [Methyloprofundus sp.]